MINQSKRVVLLLLVYVAMAFGANKKQSFGQDFKEAGVLMGFNGCTAATGAPFPQFKSQSQMEAYEKKNRKYVIETMTKYNFEGCLAVYRQIVEELIGPSVLQTCMAEATVYAILSTKEKTQRYVEKCMAREVRGFERDVRADLKSAKPFPKVDKAAQARKEKEEELERQRQIEAQAQAERLEAIEKENRILAMRLAALGEFIWENEYHRIYTESKKDRYTQDLQGCVQEQQENLNALAKEAKYFSHEQESDDGEVEIDESIKKQSAYQALAYCVIKPHFSEYETRARQEKWQEIKAEVLDSAFIKGSLAKNESTLNKHIEKLALMSFESSWAEMAEKNGYNDYENAVVSPWFAKDEATKILIKQAKEPLAKLDTLKAKLFEESNPQYKQCDKDFFRNKKKEECRQNELSSNIKALEEQIENLTKEIQNLNKE